MPTMERDERIKNYKFNLGVNEKTMGTQKEGILLPAPHIQLTVNSS